ncbi:hypothetical protein BC833DRAFT_624544 [Globomyces pollinis-pini]|nr:hypothetical protein BC833DRAFT_624544 [Globomyces pollinis-pini]
MISPIHPLFYLANMKMSVNGKIRPVINGTLLRDPTVPLVNYTLVEPDYVIKYDEGFTYSYRPDNNLTYITYHPFSHTTEALPQSVAYDLTANTKMMGYAIGINTTNLDKKRSIGFSAYAHSKIDPEYSRGQQQDEMYWDFDTYWHSITLRVATPACGSHGFEWQKWEESNQFCPISKCYQVGVGYWSNQDDCSVGTDAAYLRADLWFQLSNSWFGCPNNSCSQQGYCREGCVKVTAGDSYVPQHQSL